VGGIGMQNLVEFMVRKLWKIHKQKQELIEKIIVGYSTTADTTFQAGTTYYKNTGTLISPEYTALVSGTDYTDEDNISEFGETVYIYSDAGVSAITRTAEPNGNDYSFDRLGIKCACAVGTGASSLNVIAYSDTTSLVTTFLSSAINTGARYSYAELFQKDGFWSGKSSGSVTDASYVAPLGYAVSYNDVYNSAIADYPKTNKLVISSTTAVVIPSTTEVYVYGVRA
jgi:hypothetical protein